MKNWLRLLRPQTQKCPFCLQTACNGYVKNNFIVRFLDTSNRQTKGHRDGVARAWGTWPPVWEGEVG